MSIFVRKMKLDFDEMLIINEKWGYSHRGRVRRMEVSNDVLYTHLLDHEAKSRGNAAWRISDFLLSTADLRYYEIKGSEEALNLYCRQSGEKVTFFHPVVGVGVLVTTR